MVERRHQVVCTRLSTTAQGLMSTGGVLGCTWILPSVNLCFVWWVSCVLAYLVCWWFVKAPYSLSLVLDLWLFFFNACLMFCMFQSVLRVCDWQGLQALDIPAQGQRCPPLHCRGTWQAIGSQGPVMQQQPVQTCEMNYCYREFTNSVFAEWK